MKMNHTAMWTVNMHNPLNLDALSNAAESTTPAKQENKLLLHVGTTINLEILLTDEKRCNMIDIVARTSQNKRTEAIVSFFCHFFQLT